MDRLNSELQQRVVIADKGKLGTIEDEVESGTVTAFLASGVSRPCKCDP